MVSDGSAQIKIETSPVTRGAVYPARTMVASETVTEQFGFVETNVLAFEDLYGSKLHAALDRQHPRDLFDVKLLYENEGLTDDLFRVFMVYVASSGRPMHELLAPARPYREDLYDGEFSGMTRETVSRNALADTGRRLHADIKVAVEGRSRGFSALPSRCRTRLRPHRLARGREPAGGSLEVDQPGEAQASRSREACRAAARAGELV